ncbi:hypothetical protein NA78x_003725 [Anatilimnocola sp. NA78]|uniref:hypothetical protein n=1 Tax=Anatilimnocola sp. NA78 TaxID=3415683 RepID=UPI003CE45BF2
MPIKVACTCGAAFAAKDELAGRTVACPKCKQPLKIPAPQAAAPAPLAAHGNAGLFDDIGLKARDVNIARCPSCSSDLPPNAVLCVKCGFNLKLGKKMQTMSMSGDAPVMSGGGHGGHGGDATAMIMAKAARDAEEDVEVEKSKGSEGMPAWVLAVGLLACIVFALVMSMIPQATALGGTAALLLFAGLLLQLYAWVRVIAVAAKMNPLYAVGIFFGDILLAIALEVIYRVLAWATESESLASPVRLLKGAIWLTFAYVNSDECGQYITFFWMSLIMQFVGIVLAVIAALVYMASQKEGPASLPEPPLLHPQVQLASHSTLYLPLTKRPIVPWSNAVVA